MEKKPEVPEKQKRIDLNEDEDEVGSPVKRRRRGELVESKVKAEEEPLVMKEGAEVGKRRGERRKKLTAFGQEIPKAGLLNREFQIPLEWVPEDKRL